MASLYLILYWIDFREREDEYIIDLTELLVNLQPELSLTRFILLCQKY